MISAIVAVDNDWGIGCNGDLLEHIPADLKYFKSLTTNHTVVMGRKTWDSLPYKPLKDRMNIVITHSQRHIDKDTAFISFGEAISRITKIPKEEELFIIGGGSIYKSFLPWCERVFVTKIYTNHNDTDTYFPNLDNIPEWIATPLSDILSYNDLKYQFWVYNRII